MNNARRKILNNANDIVREALAKLSEALEMVEGVRDDEQDSLDNIPENLWGSERYEKSEEAVDNLESVISEIEDCMGSLDYSVCDSLDEIVIV